MNKELRKIIYDYTAALDEGLNGKIGWQQNNLLNLLKSLEHAGSVEVGRRIQCGSGRTDITVLIHREWLRLVAKMKKMGLVIEIEPVKHKNSWATKSGGFWDSEIYKIIEDQK